RRGLLAGPPVPTIVVRPTAGGTDPGWRDRVADLLDEQLGGVPVSVVADGDGLVALLAMVDPADVARVHAALRSELATAEVTRRALGLDGLAALGPLAGRLDANGPPGASGSSDPGE
ncbi:MAG TPA: hypothetical protein VF320_03690, partial [Acidimicrobiales bacterium]